MRRRLDVIGNHLWTGRFRWSRCWHCRLPTRWVEINFEAPLHRGYCTWRKTREYWCAVDS